MKLTPIIIIVVLLVFGIPILGIVFGPKLTSKMAARQAKEMAKAMKKNKDTFKELKEAGVDVEESFLNDNSDRLEKISTKKAQIGAAATKITTKAKAEGIKEGLSSKEQIFCKECGKPIDKDAKFCPFCGKKQ